MASAGPPMVCQVCAAGKYRDTVSLHTSEVCLDCGTGRYALDHTYEGFDSMPFALAASHHDEEVDCLFFQRFHFRVWVAVRPCWHPQSHFQTVQRRVFQG